MKISRKILFCVVIIDFLFVFFTISFAQVDTLRIATYNILKFPTAIGDTRIPYFRTVIDALKPDILVVQELESQNGQNKFLSQVLNYQTTIYQAAPFNDGYDTDNGLFYKQGKIQLLGKQQIRTDIREISEYLLLANGVEFFLYSSHLKAGNDQIDQSKRLYEATILRNQLNTHYTNTNFISVGDFNFYNSGEPGFIRLTEKQTGNDNQLNDPINKLGNWHDGYSFRHIHTQSTRYYDPGDGGSTRGMDDRFDLIFVSNSVMEQGGMVILPETYQAFGNDGNHLNLAINDGGNAAVSAVVANSLLNASDHLPVYADFVFGTISSIEEDDFLPKQFNIYQNFPNPFNSETNFKIDIHEPGKVKIFIYDLSGAIVSQISNVFSEQGSFYLKWNGKNLNDSDVSSGIYIFSVNHKNYNKSGKMILVR